MAFDADAFLSTTVTGPMSTELVLCPEGEFKAFVDDGDKALSFFSGEKNGRAWASATVLFVILDEGVKAKLKKDKVLVPMKAFLDLREDDTMDLSEGKNVSLGRLRKALNQNDGAWSPTMMKGKGPVMVKVTHRTGDDNVKRAEVTRVSALAT